MSLGPSELDHRLRVQNSLETTRKPHPATHSSGKISIKNLGVLKPHWTGLPAQKTLQTNFNVSAMSQINRKSAKPRHRAARDHADTSQKLSWDRNQDASSPGSETSFSQYDAFRPSDPFQPGLASWQH